MAQQFLHAADIGPAIQEVGGKAVPQGVGAGPLVQPGDFQVLLQHAAHAAGGQPTAKTVDEQGRSVPLRLALGQVTDLQRRLEGPRGERADGRQPFATSLAADPYQTRGEVQVGVD